METEVQIHTQIRTMNEKGLIEKGLCAYTCDHFESLKELLKDFKCLDNNCEFEEVYFCGRGYFHIEMKKEDIWFFSTYDKHKNLFEIELQCRILVHMTEFSRVLDFKFLQNGYVYRNLNKIIAIWINLLLKYKKDRLCENFLREYIWNKENIENYLE